MIKISPATDTTFSNANQIKAEWELFSSRELEMLMPTRFKNRQKAIVPTT